MDLGLALSGMPIALSDCNIAITQPPVREICALGEDNFFFGIHVFVDSSEMLKDIRQGNSRLEMLSDFQILVMMVLEDKELKDKIISFFSLIFPNYDCRFEPGSICFYENEESKRILGQINPYNFEIFQTTLSELFLPADIEEKEEYRPVNDRAAEIAEKLKKGNEIRRQLKQEKNSSDKNTSIFASYTSSLAVGMQMDINIFYNYTPFQLFDAFKRYQLKQQYDLYQKIATTPLMDTSKLDEPEQWIGNIYK